MNEGIDGIKQGKRVEIKELLVKRGKSGKEAEDILVEQFDTMKHQNTIEDIQKLDPEIFAKNQFPPVEDVEIPKEKKMEKLKTEGLKESVGTNLTHPEHISPTEFGAEFNDGKFRERLLVLIRGRKERIKNLINQTGFKVGAIERLESRGLIEGYKFYKEREKSTEENIFKLRNTPVEDSVIMTGQHTDFINFIEKTDRLIKTLEEYIQHRDSVGGVTGEKDKVLLGNQSEKTIKALKNFSQSEEIDKEFSVEQEFTEQIVDDSVKEKENDPPKNLPIEQVSVENTNREKQEQKVFDKDDEIRDFNARGDGVPDDFKKIEKKDKNSKKTEEVEPKHIIESDDMYERLGLSRDVDQETLENVYKILSLHYKNLHDSGGTNESFYRVYEAYDFIRNEIGNSANTEQKVAENTGLEKTPYPWREDITEFTGDLEYRRNIEDMLDSLKKKIVESMPHPTAFLSMSEYQKLIEVSEEIKSMLAVKTDSGYSIEERREVATKLSEIENLNQSIFTEFGVELPDITLNYEEKISSRLETEDFEMVDVEVENGKEELLLDDEATPYDIVRETWKNAREESDVLEKEYRNTVSNFYKTNEKKLFAGVKRFFGIRPEFSRDIDELREKTVRARDMYIKAGLKLAKEKYKDDAEHLEKVSERYEKMLTQKILVSTIDERNAIQQEVVAKMYPEGTPVGNVMEWFRGTRKERMAATVAAYALLGLATGGAGAVIAAGGSAITRLGGGLMGGLALGTSTKALLDKLYVGKRERTHEQTVEDSKSSLFSRDFAELERALSQSARSVEVAKGVTRGAAAAAAVVGGAGLSGFAASGSFDLPVEVPSAASPETGPVAGDESLTESPETQIKTDTPEELVSTDATETLKATPPLGDASLSPETTPLTPPSGTNADLLPVTEQPVPLPETGPVAGDESLTESPETQIKTDTPEELVGADVTETDVTETDVTETDVATHVGESYEVKSGDNLWKIVETQYASILEKIPPDKHDAFIDGVLDRLDASDTLRDAVGIKGDEIDHIHPGDTYDLQELDKIADEVAAGLSGESVVTDTPVASEAATPAPPLETESVLRDEAVEVPPTDLDDAPPENTATFAESHSVEMNDYVNTLEKPLGGFLNFFGVSDIQGTFEKLEASELKIFEIDELNTGDPKILEAKLINLDVSARGWDTWVEEIRQNIGSLSLEPAETFGEYFNRVVAAQQAELMDGQ